MKRSSLALPCLVLIAVAGCQPESAQPVTPVESPPATAAIEVAVANAVPSDRPATFDQRGFAGTFDGTVGDAEVTLALAGDGTFSLTEARPGSEAAIISGTWTAEAEDRHIRLDPDSKTEPDRLFAITSTDRIAVIGSSGEPVPGAELARQ